jgi:hypothetical protein
MGKREPNPQLGAKGQETATVRCNDGWHLWSTERDVYGDVRGL